MQERHRLGRGFGYHQIFDHVNWDILMGKIGAVIRDKRVLKLIGNYLRAGAMEDGVGGQEGVRHKSDGLRISFLGPDS